MREGLNENFQFANSIAWKFPHRSLLTENPPVADLCPMIDQHVSRSIPAVLSAMSRAT